MDESERVRRTRAQPVLELHLANDLHALEQATPRVARFLAENGVDERTRFAVELVLEEAFVNIVWHAFDDALEHVVRVELAVEPRRVRIEFADDGEAFDPTQHRPDPPATSIDAARPGGRGLRLMRHFAETLRYAREPGGNRLVATIARR